MNVSVEELGPCKRLLRVEIEAQKVDQSYEQVTSTVRRQANIPGFRRGKAPIHLVIKAYGGHIDTEVKNKLISDSYKKAIEQEKITPVTYPDIEEIQFGKGQDLVYAATIETQPQFDIPEYKKIPVKREMRAVRDEDVERALEALRQQRAQYEDMDREVRDGDYVVVNYTATADGKPLTEFADTAKGLSEQKNFWIHVHEGHFLPGFNQQLLGAKKDEHRTVEVEFPADFETQELAGKKAVYEVDIVQVKEKKMPELDDEFAKSFGAEDVDALVNGVRSDLENELKYKVKQNVRNQILKTLLKNANFELPESIVSNETRNVVFDIVRENQERGVPKETIDEKKDEIFSAASHSAKDRVKLSFIVGKIAEAEKIEASKQEIAQHIAYLAHQNGIPPEKMIKTLQDRKAMPQVVDQVIRDKVIDFLELDADVEEVFPSDSEA